jgi:DNA-binding NarL/FixJ family response regulator/class 3 adenylate cyclase
MTRPEVSVGKGERLLASILFTDIVGSTEVATRLGDRGWTELVQRHHAIIRDELERYGGREMDTAGDGFFAVFDAPTKAIVCATAVTGAVRDAGLEVRAGVHMGECEVLEGKMAGIAVHVAARLMSKAGPGEVWVSSTIHDLLAGSDIKFRDRGTHELKGLEGEWRLYSVIGEREKLPLRVVVGEDVMLTRAGIVRVLQDSGFEVVGEAGDLDHVLREVTLTKPDLVMVDIRMPPTHTNEGLVAAHRIRTDHPETGVLVLSQYVEPAYALELIEQHPGGVGYLLKERVYDPAVLADALLRIVEGECVIDPTIVSRLVGKRRREDPLSSLSEREKEVLALVAEGLSNNAIASRLFVTERTVEAHITAIFQKLDLPESTEQHRRVLAVLAYLRTR